MVRIPAPREELEKDVRALVEAKGSVSGASRARGLPRSTFRSRLEQAARVGLMPLDAVMPGFAISQVSESRDSGGKLRSRSIQQKPERQEVFEPPKGFRLDKMSVNTDSLGRLTQQWHKGSIVPDPVETAKEIKDQLEGIKTLWELPKEPDHIEDDMLSLLPLADWHWGMLAWAEESGEDWDTRIAKKVLYPAVSRVINASPKSSECVILGLGDFLHFDGYDQVTAKSKNQLSGDTRYPKVLSLAAEALVMVVGLALQRHKTVRLRILRGNHDEESAVALSLAMKYAFAESDRVDVDTSPGNWWWYRWGKVFLGGNHGDKAKMEDMPLVMAHDRPADWAASSLRHIYTGHIHHGRKLTAREFGGVMVESLRAPIPKDDYHSFSSYRAGRSMYADNFNKNGLEYGRVQFNL